MTLQKKIEFSNKSRQDSKKSQTKNTIWSFWNGKLQNAMKSTSILKSTPNSNLNYSPSMQIDISLKWPINMVWRTWAWLRRKSEPRWCLDLIIISDQEAKANWIKDCRVCTNWLKKKRIKPNMDSTMRCSKNARKKRKRRNNNKKRMS